MSIKKYNLRVKCFQNDTIQATFYSNPIKHGHTKKGKYAPEFIENPFTEEKVNLPLTKFDWSKAAKVVADQEEKKKNEEESKRDDACVRSSLARSKKAIYDYGRANVWEWLFTFTFKPVKTFSRDNYRECRKRVCEWFQYVRKNYCADIKFMIIPEQHKSGAWHFHALVADCEGLKFEVAKNNQKWRKYTRGKHKGEYMVDESGNKIPNKYYGEDLPDGHGDYVYNIVSYKRGFTTAVKIRDTKKVVNYVVKYITKDLSELTFGLHRYIPSKNLNKPEVFRLNVNSYELNSVIASIEYQFDMQLSINHIKNYVVDVNGYHNGISVFEFNKAKKNCGMFGNVMYQELQERLAGRMVRRSLHPVPGKRLMEGGVKFDEFRLRSSIISHVNRSRVLVDAFEKRERIRKELLEKRDNKALIKRIVAFG